MPPEYTSTVISDLDFLLGVFFSSRNSDFVVDVGIERHNTTHGKASNVRQWRILLVDFVNLLEQLVCVDNRIWKVSS